MDLLMPPESHDPGLDSRSGDLQLAQAPHNGFIQRRLSAFPNVRFVYVDAQHLHGRRHAHLGLLRPAVKQYRLGSTNNVNKRVDSKPPTTTVASGRCTSDPMPVARAASSCSMPVSAAPRTWRSMKKTPSGPAEAGHYIGPAEAGRCVLVKRLLAAECGWRSARCA